MKDGRRRDVVKASVRPSSHVVRTRRLRAWLKVWSVACFGLLIVQYILAGTTLSNEDDAVWKPKRALLVTAHPDDEVMFFAPLIQSFVARGVDVHGVCLSSGNADGKGVVRASELTKSYAMLGVASDAVVLVDDPKLPDGMDVQWDTDHVVQTIVQQIEQHGPFDTLITFDSGGITNHANHVACFQAVRQLTKSKQYPFLQAYVLHTLPIANKFLGLPGALARHVLVGRMQKTDARLTPGLLQPGNLRTLPPNSIAFLATPLEYVRALRAMSQHRSQLVWFRYLYVLFSGYMYGMHVEALQA